MNNSAMGAPRPGKNFVSILTVVMAVSTVAACQNVDATRTGSVLIKPVVHTASSESSVQSVYGNPMVRSLRLERPLVETTSTVRITEKAYAFAPPPRIKVGTPAPVNASFEPKVGAPAFGGSPYICSPSGFGQHASCRARYL